MGDVNTNEYHSDVDDDIWCSRCEDNVETCSKQSFLEKMQEWWKSNSTDNLEYLTGFKTSDFPSANSGQDIRRGRRRMVERQEL